MDPAGEQALFGEKENPHPVWHIYSKRFWKAEGDFESKVCLLLEVSEFLESSRSFPSLRKTKTLTDRHTALDKCAAV